MLFAVMTSFEKIKPYEFVIISAEKRGEATAILVQYCPAAYNYHWNFHEEESLDDCLRYLIDMSATNKKYVVEKLLLLPLVPNKVKMPDGTEGMNCTKCKQYFPYSEPNQTDNTLICYGCRNGKIFK